MQLKCNQFNYKLTDIQSRFPEVPIDYLNNFWSNLMFPYPISIEWNQRRRLRRWHFDFSPNIHFSFERRDRKKNQVI